MRPKFKCHPNGDLTGSVKSFYDSDEEEDFFLRKPSGPRFGPRNNKIKHVQNKVDEGQNSFIGVISSFFRRKFVFFNIPQIQYKNPWVQIMMFKNMTPTPFLRFYLDSGEQVLVDVETKSNKEIMEHIRKILGKSEETLRQEELEKQQRSHPANFGPPKYCLRKCMCQVEGQVPCPSLVPLPKEMTGKYKASLRASAQD
ncbi:PREDICTED: 28S ribosomal protein S25, mitochondrial [Dipodomys ordii]|uniref:Small ribosomal subunit protein mS25 n=1 Tax=Dipodomys ordii TaxID=10020 RepID=A0A1S3EQR0_DIPOR|nr:PREDICTED: 28S ribosomal protein S25, mitochondrial [Dipodomys ordii]